MDERRLVAVDAAVKLISNELVSGYDAAHMLGVQIAYFGRMVNKNLFHLQDAICHSASELMGKRMYYRAFIEKVQKQYEPTQPWRERRRVRG